MPSPDTLLTPELGAKICQLVEDGNRAEAAAAKMKVAASTFYLWQKRGRDGEHPYKEFALALEYARGHAECDMMAAQLAGEAKGDANTSTAAQFWLRTSRPGHYAEETRISVEVEGQVTKLLDLAERILPTGLYVDFLTAWQSERDNRPARSGEAEQLPGTPGEKLLRASDFLDTEGEPRT